MTSAPSPSFTSNQALTLAVAPLLGGGTQDDLKPRKLLNQTKRLMDSPGNRPSQDSGAMQRIIFPKSKVQSVGGGGGNSTRMSGVSSHGVIPARLEALKKDVLQRRSQREDATDQNNALAQALAAQLASTARANRAWNQSNSNNADDPFTNQHANANTPAEGAISQATIGVRSRSTLTSEQINERPARSLRQIWF